MTTLQATPTDAPAVERIKLRPRTDVFETNEALILVADVPGADQDSVELSLTDDVLVLRARPVSAAPEGWLPAGSEFELADYERSFRLTSEIDREGISAAITNGRLRVTLKKRQPRSSRIEVRAK
jgi:HSP20 family molecular chaperone IbpA